MAMRGTTFELFALILALAVVFDPALAQRRRRGRQGQNSLSNNDLKRFSEKIFQMRTPLLPRIGDLVKEQVWSLK